MDPNSNTPPEAITEAEAPPTHEEIGMREAWSNHMSHYIGGLARKLIFVNKQAMQAAVKRHHTGTFPTQEDDIHGWTVQVLHDPDDPDSWEYWRCYYWESMGSGMGPSIAVRPNAWGRLLWVEFECPLWVYYTPGRGGLVGRDCEAEA